MRCGITGASGLVGSNLVIELLGAGHDVVAIKRPKSKVSQLDGQNVKWADGDLNDVGSMKKAFNGCEVVFHCAAAVSIQTKIDSWMTETNVQGTQNVIDVVKSLGRARMVHCSTVAACGISAHGAPSDETCTWNFDQFGLDDAYCVTKTQAQERVLNACAQGLDAVIVHPSYMFGPYDVRPSSGRLIIDVIRGKIPGTTSGYNNFSDVRDVVRGMRLAAEKGRAGERYILGGFNMSYADAFNLIADIAGKRRIKFASPKPLAMLLGLGGEIRQKFTHREAALNITKVRWAYEKNFIFTSAKAERELGYKISSLRPAIEDAIKWFRETGKL